MLELDAKAKRRDLRARLLKDLHDQADGRYRLGVPFDRAGLSEEDRVKRLRLEALLDEQVACDRTGRCCAPESRPRPPDGQMRPPHGGKRPADGLGKMDPCRPASSDGRFGRYLSETPDPDGRQCPLSGRNRAPTVVGVLYLPDMGHRRSSASCIWQK